MQIRHQTFDDKRTLEIAHNKLGHALMDAKDFAGAAAEFSQAIAVNSKIAGYYDNRRMAYQHLGKFAEAMQDANKAVEMAPAYVFVYRGRASLYSDMGRYKELLADFSSAIAIDRTDGGLYIARGKTFRFSNMDNEAIDDFTTALRIDKDKWVAAYRERALANHSLGRVSLAAEDLEGLPCALAGRRPGSRMARRLGSTGPPGVNRRTEPRASFNHRPAGGVGRRQQRLSRGTF